MPTAAAARGERRRPVGVDDVHQGAGRASVAQGHGGRLAGRRRQGADHEPAVVARPPGRQRARRRRAMPGVHRQPQRLGSGLAAHREADPLDAEGDQGERRPSGPWRPPPSRVASPSVVDVGQGRLDAPDVGVVGVPAAVVGGAPAC